MVDALDMIGVLSQQIFTNSYRVLLWCQILCIHIKVNCAVVVLLVHLSRFFQDVCVSATIRVLR